MLDDTDLAEASVLVRQTPVSECLTVVAETVRWREEGDDTDHLEALLVRVPAPLTELGSVRMGT